MSPLTAILEREFRVRPRRRWFYGKRLALVGAGYVILAFALLAASLSKTSTVGLTLFRSLAWPLLSIACIMGPVVGGAAIMEEKRERTLGLLYLTDWGEWGIILGKLLCAVASIGLVMLSAMPLMILSASLGGVSAGQILLTLALLFSAIAFGSCVGLSIGALARSEVAMYVGLLGAIAFLYVVVPWSAGLIGYAAMGTWLSAAQVDLLVAMASPFDGMAAILHGKGSIWILVGNVAWLCFGLVLLRLAAAALHRRELGGAVAARGPLWRRLDTPAYGLRTMIRPPPIKGNPMSWRDYHFYYGGRAGIWFWPLVSGLGAAVLYFCGVLVAQMVLGAGAGSWGMVDHLQALASAYVAIGLLAGSYVWIFRCSRAFSRERAGGSLELVLTTDIQTEQVVNGKIWAIMLSIWPWFGVFLLGVGLFVAAALAAQDMAMLAVIPFAALMGMLQYGAPFLLSAFAIGICAIYASVRLKRHTPLIMLGVAIPWLPLNSMCCCLTVVPTVLAAIFYSMLRQDLRKWALGP